VQVVPAPTYHSVATLHRPVLLVAVSVTSYIPELAIRIGHDFPRRNFSSQRAQLNLQMLSAVEMLNTAIVPVLAETIPWPPGTWAESHAAFKITIRPETSSARGASEHR
jgi:hypothetical protein